MDWPQVFFLIVFFILFFILFTIIPRFILLHLNKLITFNTSVNFFENYLNLLGIYLFIGIPISIVLYSAASFGSVSSIKTVFESRTGLVIFIATLVILVSMRLSVLLKKREHLMKLPYVKNLTGLVPISSDRDELGSVYVSYLFDVFFTTFMAFVFILIFNILFLPDQTQIGWNAFSSNITSLVTIIWGYFINNLTYLFTSIGITIIPELLLLENLFGHYNGTKKYFKSN